MPQTDQSSIRTHPSLVKGLKESPESESWQEFCRVYGKLVRDFSIRAGLSDAEADEVVQETAISVVRNIPSFEYDPAVCRFKTWLLNLAAWRVKDQFRKRQVGANALQHRRPIARSGDDLSTRTDPLHRVPDPSTPDLGELFEAEWRKQLFTVALDRVKERFTPKQFQIFDLLVLQEWPAKDVVRALGVTLANLYVAKHRVSSAVKAEVKRLEKEFEKAAEARRTSPQG